MSVEIELVKWEPYAIHTPKFDDTSCSLCKQVITERCMSCLEKKNMTSSVCQVSLGKCGHGFHYHCINNWINTGNNICPTCQTAWNYNAQNTDQSELKRIVKKNISKSKHVLDKIKEETKKKPVPNNK